MLDELIANFIDNAPNLVCDVEGFLSDREIRFLALLAVTKLGDGEILEIGSYRGKSTIVLAEAAKHVGDSRISAVDPLIIGEYNSPRSLIDQNLRTAGVLDFVEIHQITSQQLAPKWKRPLRLLWIDGDHSYSGASTDFNGFAHHLADSGIIAFHDTLHFYDGSLRVFMEDVLLNDHFGAAGICGSIGWAQFHADPLKTQDYQQHKLALYSSLARLVPYVAFGKKPTGWLSRAAYKVQRSRVPHKELDPKAWLKAVA